MNDAVPMRIVERTRHRGCDAHRVVDRQLPLLLEPSAQAFAFDERHDVEEQAGCFAGVEQRQQVGVLEIGGDANLAQEALGAEHCAELGIEYLERDIPGMLDVPRQIHGRHAAAANFSRDFVSTRECGSQLRARIGCHWVRGIVSQSRGRCEVCRVEHGAKRAVGTKPQRQRLIDPHRPRFTVRERLPRRP